MSQVIETQLQSEHQNLEELLKEYGLVTRQARNELSDVNRERLERQAEVIAEKMESAETRIEILEAKRGSEVRRDGADRQVPSDTGINRIHLHVESKLPRIDFKEVERLIDDLLRDDDDSCASVFLMEQSSLMGGKLCAARIRELVEDKTGDFKHWPVQFRAGSSPDERELLKRLGSYLNLEPQEDLDDYAQAAVRRICDSLQSGSVVFMEFWNWEYLKPQHQVVPWFLEFWCKLVKGIDGVANEHPSVKMMALIFLDGELSQECLAADQICTVAAPDRFKILKLGLRHWTQDEIERWLRRYSGRPGHTIDQIAENIYRATNGIPSVVAQKLLSELES